MRENSKTDFNSSLQILFLTYRTVNAEDHRPQDSSHVYLNFKMCDLKIQNDKEQVLVLNNLGLDAKVRTVAKTIRATNIYNDCSF